jgi:acyl-CoA synthetase (AMP-forming)/AMP-acid ligase II
MLHIGGLTARHARYRPKETALVFGDRRWDWAAFERRLIKVANALNAAGVGRGDAIVTVLPNRPELLEVYWAAAKIGAVVVPLSPMLMGEGIASLAGDAEAKVLVTQATLAAAVGDAAKRLPTVGDRFWSVDGAAPGLADYRKIVDAASESAPTTVVAPEDVYNIMYTSGTTGMPKGIVLTHQIRALYGTLFANAFRMAPESVVMHSGSLVFNGAFVTMMPCFTVGARYVLAAQFDAPEAIETIARERVTHTMMVPSQIVALLSAPNFAAAKLASLETLLSLGAPLHQEHKDRLNALLPGRYYELYGLTEGFMTSLDRDDAVRKTGSVGVPPPFQELRILGEDGREAKTGEVGEIAGRSPMLMREYYRRPDLTAEAVRGGWLFTGDLGFVDADGFLHLVDRKKDMIDSGGVKVYPRDVEEIAARHPAVREVTVFGVPDEKWGESPFAAVVLAAPGAANEEELREWINARVAARYQRVKGVEILADFPRSTAGKILRRELRDRYWQGRKSKI